MKRNYWIESVWIVGLCLIVIGGLISLFNVATDDQRNSHNSKRYTVLSQNGCYTNVTVIADYQAWTEISTMDGQRITLHGTRTLIRDK